MQVKPLVQGDYFRVMPITTFEGIKDVTAGLAIEKKQKNDTYCVVAFIKPVFNTDKFILEDVDFRSVFELNPAKPLMIEEYQNCVSFALHALKDILGK